MDTTFVRTLPHIDECRILILKIIDQAIRDYLNLEHSNSPSERRYYEEACEFLFDADYYIDYGGVDKNLQDLLDILDIDIEWMRERVVKLKDRKIHDRRKKRKILNDEEQTPGHVRPMGDPKGKINDPKKMA